MLQSSDEEQISALLYIATLTASWLQQIPIAKHFGGMRETDKQGRALIFQEGTERFEGDYLGKVRICKDNNCVVKSYKFGERIFEKTISSYKKWLWIEKRLVIWLKKVKWIV